MAAPISGGSMSSEEAVALTDAINALVGIGNFLVGPLFCFIGVLVAFAMILGLRSNR